ncbi:O-antigen ligase family protein [Rhodoferax saidenbachensis]|uniref:O-antigen ligase-related domain-containing protein n=1 Tax=Rhodoferax saidenbachensis TaxID=1484693 RepID=A0A1P8K9V0_9BURK|nr:O-antigen ligase family protein [Rhodoferax saidenbachensis]APW42763.1 hypothetical protein RS694_09630 [Rhodoferax saidenbachensis]
MTGFLGFVALAASLPMAWMSLAKVALFLAGGGRLTLSLVRGHSIPHHLGHLWSARFVILSVLLFALGLLWTSAPMDFALTAFVKHAKLLMIVLICYMVSNASMAGTLIKVWMAGQTFVLLCSLSMALGLTPPWVQLGHSEYVVFAESYIDQSLMFAVAGALAWHLKDERLWPRWVGVLLAVLFLGDAVVLLPGRTGYLLVFAMIAMAAYWALPRKIRLFTAIVLPVVLGVFLYGTSGKVQNGVDRALAETLNYGAKHDIASSSGWRLNAWHRSLQGIAASPIQGHGTGSWTLTVKSFEGSNANQVFGSGNSSNPHQEYLLWAVELGMPGLACLLGLLGALVWDARRFLEPSTRAMQSVVVCIVITGLFNSVLYDDLIGDFLCISLGLLLAYGNTKNHHEH